jgi:DNA-binding NarL/FixJ family response regulator
MKKKPETIRILLADDHTLVRHGIRALLHKERAWKVVGEAVNGAEALEKANKLRPNLVILDIAMPKLDGLEATRQIRSSLPDTKIIVLTMHESEQMVRRVFEAGAHGYVLKSDLGGQLIKGVREVSRGKLYLTPKVSEILLASTTDTQESSTGVDSTASAALRLTPREREVTQLLAEGLANKEIASILKVAVRTVETHRANIMSKLGLHSATALVRYALREGIC